MDRGYENLKDPFYLKLSPVLMALKDNERDIESLSTQEHKMSAQETRNMICECVNNLLTDIPSVGAQLIRETGCTPQSQVVLQFLLHCVDAFPQCYVNTDNHHTSVDLTNSSESRDFTRWVISRLLRLVSSEACKVLHEKTLDVLHGILQLIKGKQIALYKEFLIEIVELMKDLTIVIEKVFCNGESPGYTVCLNRFQKTFQDNQDQAAVENVDEKMEMKLIETGSIGQSILLLDSCCALLTKSVSGLCQYAGVTLSTIWNIISFRLNLTSLALPTKAVELTSSLLKTSGVISTNTVQQLTKTVFAALLNSLPSSKGVQRDKKDEENYLKSLREILKRVLKKMDTQATPLMSAFELNNFMEKVSVWIVSKEVENDVSRIYEALICLILKWILNSNMKNNNMFFSRRILFNLAECVFSRIGSSKSQTVYTELLIVLMKLAASMDKKKSRKRNLVDTDENQADSGMESKTSIYKKEIHKMFQEKLNWLFAELTSISSQSLFDGRTVNLIEGIQVSFVILFEIQENILPDLKTKCEETATSLFKIIHQMPQITNENSTLSNILHVAIRCLDSLVLLTAQNNIILKHDTLCAICECIFLPWLDCIDPPWYDWKPGLHSEAELKQLRQNLEAGIDCEYIKVAIHIMMQVLGNEFTSWKIHIFRVALGHPNTNIQTTAINYLPIFLTVIGEPSHSIVPEEISPLIRSTRGGVRSTLANISGCIACALAGNCHVEFYNTSSTAMHESEDDRPSIDGCKITCYDCEEGKQQGTTLNVNLFKPFFQLLKPDSSCEIKLALIGNLQKFMNHMSREQEPIAITSVLWTSFLELIDDRDLIVRLKFSRVIDEFVKRKEVLHIQQLLVNRLKQSFLKASNEGNLKLLETIILTLGSVGKAAEGDLLLVVVISLLECLITHQQSISAVAFYQIQEVASHHKIPCQELLSRHKIHICDFLISKFRDGLVNGKENTAVVEMITEVAHVFQFKDCKAFLQSNIKVILPRIIRYSDKYSSHILRIIAKQLNINRREMLFYNFKFSFSYLVRNCSGTELEKTLKYLQNETDVELGSLLLSECQSVFNQLLLYLSVNREQVFTGLSILAHNDSTYTGPHEIQNNRQMADFLKPKLLGVLAFFNSVLTYNDIDERRLALQSLVSLMQLMGPSHITVVRLKIMAILRLGMKIDQDNFADLCCSGWEYFVHNVDLKTLGPLLGQIVVTLFPFLDKCANKVAAIFKFLLIENKATMKEYFKDIYFMPDHPVIKEVNKVVRSTHVAIKTISDFKNHLNMAIQGAMNENSDVKKFALKKLAELLSQHQNYLQEFILASESVQNVITSLVKMLTNCCKEADRDTRDLIGICLGQLGAIDPGRLEISSDGSSEDFVIYENGVEDCKFAFDLINELCRAFLAANDTRAQDCSAYAIQEVLLFYKCDDIKKDSAGYRIWKQFPEQTQEVLKPHLHSKYVHSSSDNWARISKPIFGSNKGSNFKEWLCTWVGLLISQTNKNKAAAVFRPCISIVKHDLKTATFVLPHALLYGVVENDDVFEEILLEIDSVLKSVKGDEQGFGHLSSQVVFSILDFLHVWIQKALQIRCKNQDYSDLFREENQSKVENFLNRISKSLLSSVAFSCKTTARSLMYLESHIDSKEEKLQSNLEMLQKIYYSLDEPDGIIGISAIRKGTVSLKEQIIEHESSGRLRDAASCYEKAIQMESNEVTHYQGLLKCLIRLGQLNTAHMDASGIISKRQNWTNDIRPYQSEAAWRLGQWDTLNENLDGVSDVGNWSIALGKLLVHLKDQKQDEFQNHLKLIREEQMKSLSATGLDLGDKSYEFIVRLHMLQEVEQCFRLMNEETSQESKAKNLIHLWEQRYQATQAAYRTREEILSLRRVLLDFLPSYKAVALEKDNCWLRIAKIARKAGHFQTAYSSLLNVSETRKTDTIIERNKWIWSQGDKHKALLCLEKDSSYIQSNSGSDKMSYSKQNLAKVLLRVGRWMEETESHEPQPILNQYKEVVSKCGDWEKSHFFLAKYYQKVMNAYDDKSKIKITDFVPFVVKHYAWSLQYGCKYVYQSMPTLLTLWLDFGVKCYNMEQDKDSTHHKKLVYRERLQAVNQVIRDCSKTLPAYQFLTAFSQLISRICHPSPSVWELLQEIISQIFTAYKEQAFWNIVAVCKSSFKTRKDRCSQIFSTACSQNKDLRIFIEHSLKLTDRLLEVCNKPCRKDTKLTMSSDFQPLRRLLTDRSSPGIMIPLQSTLTVILPSGHGAHQNHIPFPDSFPTFAGIEDAIEVLNSLQKPKKIVILGSDGKKYPMMCKPKDDLRKDGRLMEFNALVNKLLLRDPECRRRQLHIRTYAVIPLSEECGLLEWVSNTTGLRQITDNLYKEKKIVHKLSELRKLYSGITSSDIKTKIEIFKNQVLPKYPPVFPEWFLRKFPNPSKWYMARLSYCRTTAVMSMVGYVLGLGDRHGENILFDSTNGDCFHVDFNCLFNKGETFDYPERVPFRLTQQLVSAMGSLGYEGIFRRSCEVTMKLMRNQKDSLLSVLNTFLYDPLVEWTKERRKQSTDTGEVTNEKALVILRNVEDRLLGYCVSMKNLRLNLSIEGQVHQLIKEASSLENLSQMYIGWAAYL